MKTKLLMLLCASAILAPAYTHESDVQAAMTQLQTAMIKKDRPTLEKLVAENITYSHSNGNVENKKQMIDAILSPDMVYHSLDLADATYHTYGNTVLVRSKLTVTNSQKGERKTLPLSVLFVWVKEKGNWQLAARQSTRLP